MEIPYRIIDLKLKAQTELKLPDFKGSTFRGGFGHIFRKITCVLKKLDCIDCPLKKTCIYSYVFETPSDENSNILNMSKYEKVPHPFVFEPPQSKRKFFNPDEKLNLRIILIGRATEFSPYFVYAISEIGKSGIGKGRGKFSLENTNISDTCSININSYENKYSQRILKIRAVTPIRIKYNRELVRNIEFHILIRSLLRRLSLLYYFHVSPEILIDAPKELILQSEKIKKVLDRTYWYDWERYSSRQDSRMKLGGVVGEMAYEGDISPFMPYLNAGEIFHIGKGTSFGLGKYEIINSES